MTDEKELEKKFKEDLERAQALSLESLALEKFRLQKLQKERKKGYFIGVKWDAKRVNAKISMTNYVCLI